MTSHRDPSPPTSRPTPPAGDGAAATACTAPPGPVAGRIDEEARRRLGRDLRLHYAAILSQPLPERLTRLVETIAAQADRGADNYADREGSP